MSKRRALSPYALAWSFTAAVVLLLAGPTGTAHAIASTNNLNTVVSLNTNPVTGSNTFTTLAPITLTCGVVDVTAGAADGVSGITLRLSAGWTFQGGSAPTISYAAWPAPDGQATGTIASANTITNAITTSCSPGSVVTFTGVQVQPLTETSPNGTIIADINTADVTVATITTQAATPTPTPTVAPTATTTAVPTATPTVAPTATTTAVPTATPAAPTATPSTPTGAPLPAPTGSGGLIDSGNPLHGWLLGLLLLGVSAVAVAARITTRAKAER